VTGSEVRLREELFGKGELRVQVEEVAVAMSVPRKRRSGS
jgi:hypothetical protein